MKRHFIISAAALALAGCVVGCGQVGRVEASLTGYSKTCVDGVQYIQFTSGATPALKPDGTVKTCS